MPIVQSIPANQVVAVQPSVLSAGGTALQIIGLVLTTSWRVPIGTVVSFSNPTDVATYFGAGSTEAAIASVYFNGYVGATVLPQNILFAQYNTAPVSAYLRGDNVAPLTLSQLQALSGGLTVVMDGYSHTISNQSLSAATSFSSAATILQTAFAANVITAASVTASIGGTATGTGSTTNLTLSSVVGLVSVGDTVTGTGVPANTTIVSQTSGTPGGAGIYVTSNATTASSGAITIVSNVLNVTAVSTGAIAIGNILAAAGVTVGTIITGFTGTTIGGIGTYTLSGAKQTVASETMTTQAAPIAITFDSVANAFVFTSGVTGVTSTAAFATGTLATPLQLTLATGAVISQGAAVLAPDAFMTALVQVTQNFVTFMTAFDPDNGSGNAQKLIFATWTSNQNNQYCYVCKDTDVTPTGTVPATTSLGYLISQSNLSGTCLIYEPVGPNLYTAAFMCGTVASINFNQTNGRITAKFRTGAGIAPGVTNATVASNLAANGYNFYGGYATRNQNFQFFANGVVSGQFKWMDSYINQIWLNNQLQLAILTGMTNVGSIPYNSAGNALIEAFCADPINQALNFGAIRTGVQLSVAQQQELNQAAGANIAPVVQTRGWYLQVKQATAQVRANRGSPPCTLWYADGGSVQQINLASIEVQ